MLFKKLSKINFFVFSQNLKLIEKILNKKINPILLNIVDESNKHVNGNDSHFRVYMVSDYFKNTKLLDRHKDVIKSLKDNDVMNKIHAISIVCRTQKEHKNTKHGNLSPPCINKKN